MKKTINMTRIYPPPRWPLIHEAKRIYKEQGKEGFDRWAESLPEETRDELARQLSDLLAEAWKKLNNRKEEE